MIENMMGIETRTVEGVGITLGKGTERVYLSEVQRFSVQSSEVWFD